MPLWRNVYRQRRTRHSLRSALRLSKIPFGAFRQVLQPAAAHKQSAKGGLFARLRSDRYFVSGTRPDTKCFEMCFPLARNILRSFFYRLKCHGGVPWHLLFYWISSRIFDP